jgi:hypothetical protein
MGQSTSHLPNINCITSDDIGRAYEYYKIRSPLYDRMELDGTTHIRRIRRIDDISIYSTYYYKDRINDKYIIRIEVGDVIVKVYWLAKLNIDTMILLENSQSTYYGDSFTTMLNNGRDLIWLNKNYTETYSYTNVRPAANLPLIVGNNVIPISSISIDTVIVDEVIDIKQSYVDNMTCTICITNKVKICLDCGHLFCNACVKQLKDKCFICGKSCTNKIKIYI